MAVEEPAWVEHLSELREKFRDDREMLELLDVAERILNGDFEFQWSGKDGTVVVEGVITLTPQEGIVPSKDSLHYYFLSGYPSVVFLLFMERVRRLMNREGVYVPARDFEVLRATFNNLDLLGAQLIPEDIEVRWGKKTVLKLPLEVEVETRGDVPSDLRGMSMFIASNLDKVLERIKSMLVEVET